MSNSSIVSCRALVLVAAAALLAAIPSSAAPDFTGTITCRIETGQYRIEESDSAQRIYLENFGVIGEQGKPRLPGKIFAVAIPPGAQFAGIRTESGGPLLLDGSFDIGPTPLTEAIGGDDPGVRRCRQLAWQAAYDEIYSADNGYPAAPVTFVRRAGFRKYNLVDVRVAPFRFHPQSGRLFLHRALTIHVDYSFPARMEQESPMVDYVPAMEQTAREIILNYEEAQDWYPPAPAPDRDSTFDLVIIANETLLSSTGEEITDIGRLCNHERLKGRLPKTVSLEWIVANYPGYDTAASVRSFLRDKYPSSAWGIRDVLLLAHYSDLPMRECWVDGGYGRPFSDFYFAELSLADGASWDLDGDRRYAEEAQDSVDLYSEVNVGRIPFSDPYTVGRICDKSIAYERNSNPAFKKNILALGSFFWEDTDTAVLMEAKLDQPWMAEWTATRMYEDNGTVQSIYAYDYELTHSNAISVWSAGTYCFVNMAGHGSSTSVHQMGYGAQAFCANYDYPLLNDNYPAIVWADACSTNYYWQPANLGRCLIYQGAVGYVGSTQVADGQHGWTGPEDGSSQTLDYWFTLKVTSGEMSQGEAHQWAMRQLYIDGHWTIPSYEMYEWTILGNPSLGLGEMHSPAGFGLE